MLPERLSEVRTNGSVDSPTARLLCIEEAVKLGYKMDDTHADWLKAAVKVVEDGGVVNEQWLNDFDLQNANI